MTSTSTAASTQPASTANTASTTTANITTTTLNHTNKTAQSIIQKYTVECKSKFDELSKIILKLNLCRKELREYDKQFKTTSNCNSGNLHNTTNPASASISRKNSMAVDQLLLNSKQQQNSFAASLIKLQQKVNVLNPQFRNTCFGCASASIENCITLLRALLCCSSTSSTPGSQLATSVSHNLMVNYIKSELCHQGILDELINFNLKRHILFGVQTPQQAASATTAPSTAPLPAVANPMQATAAVAPAQALTSSPNQRMYDRDLINLIFILLKDNPEGSERFQQIITSKVETFLTPIMSDEALSYPEHSCLNVVSSLFQISGGNSTNSPLKYELMLLGSLMQKQDDTCWESRLRLVIHLLLRSLSVAESCMSSGQPAPNGGDRKRLNNPVLIECLTLPCLRILNHVAKTTTNLTLLSSLASSSSTQAGKGSGLGMPAGKLSSFMNNNPQMLMSNMIRPSMFASGSLHSPAANLNRFYSEPHDINYAQSPHTPLNNNYLTNTPGLSELDTNEFLQAKTNQSYYSKWLQLNQKSKQQGQCQIKSGEDAPVSSVAAPPPSTSLSPQMFQAKAKYFSAWRKYTLKKRKQQQQMMQQTGK